MAIYIKLRQSKFKDEQRGGKWFAQTVSQGEVHTKEIARIIEENSTFKRGEVKGMIDEIVETMTRLMQQGQTVVLDGFGRFKLTAVSTGADSPENFDLKKNITEASPRLQNTRRTGFSVLILPFPLPQKQALKSTLKS